MNYQIGVMSSLLAPCFHYICLDFFHLLCSDNLCIFVHCFQHINGIAQVKLAKFGSVDMDFVLGVGGYDLERLQSTLFLPIVKSFILFSIYNIYFLTLCVCMFST